MSAAPGRAGRDLGLLSAFGEAQVHTGQEKHNPVPALGEAAIWWVKLEA